MNLKPVLFLAIAIGLYFLSHSLELRGDAAPISPNGVSPERSKYHTWRWFYSSLRLAPSSMRA